MKMKNKIWIADKFDWTAEGMKECIYGHGDWVKRTDYTRRMQELLIQISNLMAERDDALARAATRLKSKSSDKVDPVIRARIKDGYK